LGRFVRAGVTAAWFRTRGPERHERAVFDAALAEVAAQLAAWPVERVTVRDVPGMAFWVEPPAERRPGWLLTASLTVHPQLPGEPGLWRRVLDRIAPPDPEYLGPPAPLRWSAEETFPGRAGRRGRGRVGPTGRSVKGEVTGRWPGPRALGAAPARG